MKIVTIVRTRNEEENIVPFVKSYYDWVDGILIADGGSTDGTKERLAAFAFIVGLGDKVKVRDFTERVEYPGGVWRNPEGRHINFLIDWAKEEGADWVIFDDCDCRPNALLRRDGRSIIEACQGDVVNVVRIYWWGDHEYFPYMSQPRTPGQWEASLWAWRVASGLRCLEDVPFGFHFEKPPDSYFGTWLWPPVCLNHHGWPDMDTVERKYQHYRVVQLPAKALHPLEFAGRLEPLPSWTAEEP